jgi:hypothetical protein
MFVVAIAAGIEFPYGKAMTLYSQQVNQAGI